MSAALHYVVTYLPANRSEPVQSDEPVVTGDPDIDADTIIDDYFINDGAEVIHIRWSTGGTVYAASGIDR